MHSVRIQRVLLGDLGGKLIAANQNPSRTKGLALIK